MKDKCYACGKEIPESHMKISFHENVMVDVDSGLRRYFVYIRNKVFCSIECVVKIMEDTIKANS